MQAASDVNSPVSGEVTAVNDSLTDDSAKVSKVSSEGIKLPCVSSHQQSVRKLLHAIASQVKHVLLHLVKCSKVRKQAVRN